MTNINDIIDEIYYLDDDLFYDIVLFLEKNNPPKNKINKESFVHILTTNMVYENPIRFLEYFDTIDIRVGILPVYNQEKWSFRIYFRDKVIIENDFDSRQTALFESIKKAVKVYREIKHNKDAFLKKHKTGLTKDED